MADVKISGLPASTTPLAGTEVLPIVQGGVTKKISVADLTAGRAVSALSTSTTAGLKNTSAGADTASAPDGFYLTDGAGKNAIVQLGASGQLSTFVFEAGGAGWRRVAALLTNGNSVVDVGNLVIGTSGKGIDFSATAGTGTSELLADYEEGTWTPSITGLTSNSGQAYSVQLGKYTKIGRQVNVQFHIVFSAEGTFSGALLQLSGLPYTISNDIPAISGGLLLFGSMGSAFTTIGLQLNQNNTTAFLTATTVAATGTGYVGATDLSDTTLLTGQFTYFV